MTCTPPPGSGSAEARRWKDSPLTQELFIIHNMIMRIGDRLVADLGLTSSRWLMLGAVSRYEEPPTLSDLSGDALLSVQNVSRMIAAMENDGLLERFRKPGAGRSIFVRLTERGEAVRERACSRAHVFSEGMLAGMSGDEVAALQAGVDRMIENLGVVERRLAEGDLVVRDGTDDEPAVGAREERS